MLPETQSDGISYSILLTSQPARGSTSSPGHTFGFSMNATWIAFAIGMIIGGSIGIMIIGMLSICRDDEEYIMAKPRIVEPQEDMFHKYPVLKIPTGKRNELLIIGREKAVAILAHLPAIRSFVERHAGKAAAE